MKKALLKLCSAALSLCILVTMTSCLFGIVASAEEITYDSGNMPSWFFDPDSYAGKHAYALADGSLRINNKEKIDFGTDMSNKTISFDMKAAGHWSLVFRGTENSAGTDIGGYVIGYDNGYLYISKVELGTGKYLARCATAKTSIFTPMKWHKMTISFEDTDKYTAITVLIDDTIVPFADGSGVYSGSTFETVNSFDANASVSDGRLYDFNPIQNGVTTLKIRPFKMYGYEANKASVMYFRSVDADLTEVSDPFKITFVGDSITHSIMASNWNTTLPSQMNDLFGNTFDCYNGGSSGSTAVKPGYGWPYELQNQYTFSHDFKGDLVIMMLGSNDANYLRDETTKEMFDEEKVESWHTRFITDYTRIAQSYIDEGAQIIFMLPPCNYNTAWTWETLQKVGEWVTEIGETLGVKVFDMWEVTEGHEDWFADGCHPNDEGYSYMAAALYDWLLEESGVDFTKNIDTTLETATLTAELAEQSKTLESYDGTFDKDMFRAYTCPSGWITLNDTSIKFVCGGVETNSSALSLPSFHLGANWSMSFTMVYPSPQWNDYSGEIGSYAYENMGYTSTKMGGLDLRVAKVKNKTAGAYHYIYRLFMNNVELCDPFVSPVDWFNLTSSYKIEFNCNKVKVTRTDDNLVLFDLDSIPFTDAAGYSYKFNNSRIQINSYIFSTIWTNLKVESYDSYTAEYDITSGDYGHIELGGETFDGKSSFYIGETLRLNAVCDEYGYMFVKWVDGDGNKLSSDPTYSVTFGEEKTVLRAVFGPFASYSDFYAEADEGGSVVSNGEAIDFNGDFLVGDQIELTAVADEGYEFGYWANENGDVLSLSATWTATLAKKSYYKAVFFKSALSETDTANIAFYGRNGKLVTSYSVGVGTVIALPSLPYAYGYTCVGWTVNGTTMKAGATFEVSGDMIIFAAYVKDTAKYTVTVDGGSIGGTETTASFDYNTKITVVFDQNSLSDGEMFGGWHISGSADGSVISYDPSYTFYVGADVTLYAYVSTSAADVKPVTDVTDVSLTASDGKVSFLTERTLPEGYTLVGSGVVYTADATKADALTLDGLGNTVFARAASSKEPNGQFRFGVSSRDGCSIKVYIVSYLIYIDTAGVEHTIYSDVYSGTTVTVGGSQDIIEDGNDDF